MKNNIIQIKLKNATEKNIVYSVLKDLGFKFTKGVKTDLGFLNCESIWPIGLATKGIDFVHGNIYSDYWGDRFDFDSLPKMVDYITNYKPEIKFDLNDNYKVRLDKLNLKVCRHHDDLVFEFSQDKLFKLINLTTNPPKDFNWNDISILTSTKAEKLAALNFLSKLSGKEIKSLTLKDTIGGKLVSDYPYVFLDYSNVNATFSNSHKIYKFNELSKLALDAFGGIESQSIELASGYIVKINYKDKIVTVNCQTFTFAKIVELGEWVKANQD